MQPLSDMHIHLISFDVPFPPNYGGVIDIYYKLKKLKENNVSVTLHCFEYGRGEQNELNELCKEVFYYKRKSGLLYQFSFLPYIVITRSNNQLLKNVLKDSSPIFFEGIHCCYLLNHKALQQRKKIVRMHNVESDYYLGLARSEKNLFKKIFFKLEAFKLKWFEQKLQYANLVFAISLNDKNYFLSFHNNVQILPPFHPFNYVISTPGKSTFCLYHGNLAVSENNEAALYLTEKIFNDLEATLIIAGNAPSSELKNAVKKYKNIQLLPDVGTEDIWKLVSNAHINVLPTFQNTGVKLKLLVALYTGRFCLVNNPMVENTGLERNCEIANSSEKMKQKIIELLSQHFSEMDIKQRSQNLENNYSSDMAISQVINALQ
ncbi:hypothetical protein FLAV_00228 [Flavobacteriales bacterium]|nr:hypothetical protein [Flavobacteriales bacterium]CAG0951601.1 hypothetical protein FLAV_00228 [Flavobacteriales bacterium]